MSWPKYLLNPLVEFIKVSSDKDKRIISNIRYTMYIEELSSQKLPDNYADIKKAALSTDLTRSNLKSESASNPEEAPSTVFNLVRISAAVNADIFNLDPNSVLMFEKLLSISAIDNGASLPLLNIIDAIVFLL